jgi:hypothetical protein
MHVFVCPRLLKPEWFQQLYKAADLVFDVLPGASCWPKDMHEPLIIGVVFPYLRTPPWQLHLTPKMLSEWGMHLMWQEPGVDPGDLLRQFLLVYERLRTMLADVVRRVLFLNCEILFHVTKQRAINKDRNGNDPMHQQHMQAAWGKKQRASDDFLHGWDGDHAMVPFECDLCVLGSLS